MSNNPAEANKKPLIRPWTLVVIAGVAIFGFQACSNAGSSNTSSASSYAPLVSSTRTVVYEVFDPLAKESTNGTPRRSASVTMTTPTGTKQITPYLPMTSKDGTLGLSGTFERGAFVSLIAQDQNGYGRIACRITVDGKVISENSSSGGYSVVQCSGSV